MPLPISKVNTYMEQIHGLSRDDGPMLARIIWRLRHETARGTQSDDLKWALVDALARAGLAEEARRILAPLVTRVIEQAGGAEDRIGLLQFEDMFNATAMTGILGHTETSLKLAQALVGLSPRSLPPGLMHVMERQCVAAAIHAGNVDFLQVCARFFKIDDKVNEAEQFLSWLAYLQLLPTFSAQQQALCALLDDVTSFFIADTLVDPEGGARLALNYFTKPDVDLEKLDQEVTEVLEAVYSHHPEGAAFTLGRLIVTVQGPLIALPPGDV